MDIMSSVVDKFAGHTNIIRTVKERKVRFSILYILVRAKMKRSNPYDQSWPTDEQV